MDLYDRALVAYKQLDRSRISENPVDYWRIYGMQPGLSDAYAYLAQGIFQEQRGSAGYALEIYNTAWEILPDDPMTIYLRAQLLGAMGRGDEASFDTEWLRQFAVGDPELTSLIDPLVKSYPLRTERFEDWLVYPVNEYFFGPGGEYAGDTTSVQPMPVQLAWYPEVNGIFATGLNKATGLFNVNMPADALVLKQNGNIYNYSRPMYYDEGGKIHLEMVNPDNLDQKVFTGNSSLLFFEAYGYQTFLIAPAGAPDPRTDVLGERCGVISRFRSGMTVEVTAWTDEIVHFFDIPDGAPTITAPADQPVTVIKSQCVENTLWWYATTGDNTFGWIMENDGTEYVIHPTSDASRYLTYCPAVPQPHLFIGGQGTVIPGSGVNNVRAETRVTASVVTQIPENAKFSVIGGPVCSGGFLWWHVDYAGSQGWTAEGTLEKYWLSPVLPEVED